MNEIQLFNDDCFNIFPDIEDKSINLFILDLPFGQISMKWDTPINLEEMWKHIKRIMKPDALIIFFCSAKFGYTLIQSNPKWFKYDLIWSKSRKVSFLSANRKPLVQHENIYIFKNKQGTYNPQKTKRDKEYKKEDGKHPTSILIYKNPPKPIHRTQKPVDLLEWLIKSYSNEGDTIMDFTMGSGTCAVACMNTNRKFIGVEKDEEIYNLAFERIENHKK